MIPRVPVAEWEDRFPWLAAGTTARRPETQAPNFGLFTELPVVEAMAAWTSLMAATGLTAAVHARQVHGAGVLVHDGCTEGLRVVGAADGHATRRRGLLLTVAGADCVPVFAVDGQKRCIALLHAGWRGTVAGVLETGLATLGGEFGARASDLHIHLGPAICGGCYEVGPEVFEALGLPKEERLDLRWVLGQRAANAGVPVAQITTSPWCTKCPDSRFFSHRSGHVGRHVAYLGIRA